MRYRFVSVLFVLCAALLAAGPADTYRSPYSVQFTHPLSELIGDIEHGPRGNRNEESSLPHQEWLSRQVREKFGSWGPPARHYPAPAGLAGRSVSWQRERVLATAL